MNELCCRSKCSHVAAGVYDSGRDAFFYQRIDCTVDGKAFGDSAKIDNHAPAKSHRKIFFQDDVAPAPVTRFWMPARKIVPRRQETCDGDVENTFAFPRELQRCQQNMPRPWMDNHLSAKRIAIELCHIARRIVKAHEPMNLLDRSEGMIDIAGRSIACKVNNRAEERPGPPQLSP